MASLGDSVERRVAFVTRLEGLVGALTGRRVLDLGCGRHALWTRAYTARGADVVAVELDPARCAEAIGRLATAPPSGGRVLGVVRGDGERLPLPAETVAFVHCAQVLEHVGSPAAFLREVRRVLRPGGHAYLTAINRHALRDPHFGVIGVNYLPRRVADRVLRPGGYAYLTAINRHALRDPHFGVVGVNYLPPRVADRVLDLIGAVNPEGQPLSAMHYFSRAGFRRLCDAVGLEAVVDLKRAERLARHGRLGGRLADLWGSAVRSAAFHMIVRRPAGDAVRARAGSR